MKLKKKAGVVIPPFPRARTSCKAKVGAGFSHPGQGRARGTGSRQELHETKEGRLLKKKQKKKTKTGIDTSTNRATGTAFDHTIQYDCVKSNISILIRFLPGRILVYFSIRFILRL
jgi:hypothetical protein